MTFYDVVSMMRTTLPEVGDERLAQGAREEKAGGRHRRGGGAGQAEAHDSRGLHSFRFQLNLSSPVHRVTQLNPECVLELLKFSSNVNECKPQHDGRQAAPGGGALGLR